MGSRGDAETFLPCSPSGLASQGCPEGGHCGQGSCEAQIKIRPMTQPSALLSAAPASMWSSGPEPPPCCLEGVFVTVSPACCELKPWLFHIPLMVPGYTNEKGQLLWDMPWTLASTATQW